MTTISEIYASCITAAHLKGAETQVTITGGEIRKMDDGKRKLFLKLAEFPSTPFCVNVTNAKRIAKLHGEEVTAWVGKQITLYPTTTDFQGKEVDCIRVRTNQTEAMVVPAVSSMSPAAPSSGAVRF